MSAPYDSLFSLSILVHSMGRVFVAALVLFAAVSSVSSLIHVRKG